MWSALSGHSSTQVSQSTHSSALMTAFSSTISIAADGQMSTQVAHPVHFSLLTTAGILDLPRMITIFLIRRRNTFRVGWRYGSVKSWPISAGKKDLDWGIRFYLYFCFVYRILWVVLLITRNARKGGLGRKICRMLPTFAKLRSFVCKPFVCSQTRAFYPRLNRRESRKLPTS